MKFGFFFVLFVVVFAAAVFAQPTIVWQTSLGGISDDNAYSIQQTADGGFIVAGQSYSNDGDVSGNHGNFDYWIVKLNSSGDIQWQKCLGGGGPDLAISIQQTADGGFIVAGDSYSNDGDVSGNHGDDDYWVVKLNSSGEIVWQTSLGGTSYDKANSIQQTADGGFIVAGDSRSINGDVSGNHGSYDYWVVKLNSAGDMVWQRALGGSSDDVATSIQQTADGGFIVAGKSASNDGDVTGNHGSNDYWVVKLNSAGDMVWQRALGGSSDDVATSIQQTADGGFIVAGFSYSNDGDVTGHHWSTGYGDYWVVKLNSAGDMVWQRALGGSYDDRAYSIEQTTDGGFIVAGESASNDGDVTGNHGGWDYWVVKLLPDTINHPPIISGCPEDTITVSVEEYFSFSAFDSDSDNLHFSLIEFPDTSDIFWMDIDTSGTDCSGTFDFFSDCHPELYSFAFMVCDEEYCDTCHFFVKTINSIPVIFCPPETIWMNAGDDTTVSFWAYDSCEADTLIYELIEHPTFGSWWHDSTFGIIHLIPSIEDTGTFNFAFSICDQWDACDTCNFTVVVVPDSSCPGIADFNVLPISSHSLGLSWDYSGVGTPDSIFLWRIEEDDTIQIAALVGSLTEYTDSGLNYATEYTYQISSWCTTSGMSEFRYSNASTYYFRREVDGFQFCNCGGVVWPYDDGTPSYPFPDWETFVMAYGDSQVLDPYGNPRPAALEFWNVMKGHWRGSCFGFTSVSLHLFGNTLPYDISDWGVESSIDITVSDEIRRLINAEQIRQPYYSTYLGGGTIPDLYVHSYYTTSSDASALINDLENNMVNDLQNLCFFVWGWGGHSITPYKLDTISTDEYRIYCYDNWSAYYDFYFDVNTSTGDIVYHRTHYGPSAQNVGRIQLMPSRPFAQPPVMDFYSGGESKELSFAGTGQGFLSLYIEKPSTGESSYFSIDTFYNTGEQFIVFVPSDTLEGPSTPDWALQLSSGNYNIQLVGDSIAGAKLFITAIGRLYAMDFQNLEYGDTITINIHIDGSYSIISDNNENINLDIGALLDTTYNDEGIHKLNISDFSGTLSVNIQEATSSEMKIAIGKRGGGSVSYTFSGILTNYADSTSPQDTITFPDSILFIAGEQQIIDVNLGEDILDGFIARDPDADGIYEDTIYSSASVDDNNRPIQFALSIVPNPFNASISVNYNIANASDVSLEIYDVLGQKVVTLINKRKSAGKYTTTWTAPNDIPSGIYFVRLKAGNQTITKRAVLIR